MCSISLPYRILCLLLFFSCLFVSIAQADPKPRFKAVAFDYFVIFNPNSIIPDVEKVFPGRGEEFVKLWRTKQFEYCFLRSITGHYKDFYEVTEDALIYTAQALNLKLTPEDQAKLLSTYLKLKPWPDSIAALRTLKKAGVRLITIANFSPKMLQENARNAGIEDLFENLLSTATNQTYKPDPRAYELGLKTLGIKKEEILFTAFGGWDAAGAKSFGYTTVWVNRLHLPEEILGVKADRVVDNANDLVNFVLGSP